MLELKEYQKEALEILGKFCDEVRAGFGRARRPVHDAFHLVTEREFHGVPQLPDVPYVCLRVPTGGGKTLMAAHAVGVIAKRLGRQDFPLCLWVTPTTTIRDQTLKGLRDRNHPYHSALRETLGVPLEVMTLDDAFYLSRGTAGRAAVVIVTTIQSYRIDDESNRRIYQDDGYLMDHFSALAEASRAQVVDEETGRVRYSLANAMKLRGPIVVMDEAHNARTKTSFDSLERMGPLAVLELTATPVQVHDPSNDVYASNVLHAVSALELKREGMIKLPVELESRENWLDVLSATVEKRKALAARAEEWRSRGGRYVRPIALIQAQPRDRRRETHTVEGVKAALVEKLNVPVERIRVATGDEDEIGEEDLNSEDSTVEYVITVEKLRQGWDCPFAYVLGSVGNVATPTAVEQLLGRVLRMPHAKPTGVAELDRAYAIVQSDDVLRTAGRLADGIVQRCGFDENSARDAFRVQHRWDERGGLPFTAIPVSAPPESSMLSRDVREKLTYEAERRALIVHHPLTSVEAKELRDALPSPQDKAAVDAYWEEEREIGAVAKSLGQYAQPLRVPRLSVRDGQRLFLYDPFELDEFDWELGTCAYQFGEADFSSALHIGDRTEMDVSGPGGGFQIGRVEEIVSRQAILFAADQEWDKPRLVRWLDRELHRGGKNTGLRSAESLPWLIRLVDFLLDERAISLELLVRKRHDLANAVEDRIEVHGRRQVQKAAEQLFASAGGRRLETTFDLAFEIMEQDYAPTRRHEDGRFDFRKHAFEYIGHMGGEESECAKRIDDHPNVKRWLRNLTHESARGFHLPLSPGRFFPDFLAELQDGRTAVIEYKNRILAQAREELHKKSVGEIWAASSSGKCVFSWVVERDWTALDRSLASVG